MTSGTSAVAAPSSGSSKKAAWIAATVTGLCVLLLLVIHVARVVQAIGDWCYTLDDAYIHLAIAKTLSEHGVWGLTRFYPAGASSSPLWTLLHAATGAGELVPLVLNLAIASGGSAWLAALCARRSGSAAIGIVMGLAAAVVLSLLSGVMTGMEHLFHTLLCVLFLVGTLAAAREESEGQAARPFVARPPIIGLLATLAVLCRAESLLVLPVAFLLLLGRRRYRAAAAVALGGVVAIGLYWVIGKWQGIPAIPNSVSIKALETNGSGLFGRFLLTVNDQKRYGFLAALAIAAFLVTIVKGLRERTWTPTRLAILASTPILPLHLLVGKMGHVGRYEVYALTILAAFTFPEIAGRLRRGDPLRKTILISAGVPALAIFAIRPTLVANMVFASNQPFGWSREIDASPREMARFVNRHLPGTTVLLNDVGAVSYYTNSRVLDLWGLGNNEVARERLRVRGIPSPEWFEAFARREGGELTMIFEPWFDERSQLVVPTRGRGVPRSWTKVGEFRLNVPHQILGGPVVSLYAVRPQDAPRFRDALRRYRPRSPLNQVVVF